MQLPKPFIQPYWRDFVSLFFPETCLLCHRTLMKNEEQICTSCQVNLPVTRYHLRLNDNPVFHDLKIVENLKAACAYLKYRRHGMAQKLLKALKYRGNYDVGVLMGSWYGQQLRDIIRGDGLIPVPIHPTKYKQRGYNQSVAIAEGLQEHLDIPIHTTAVIRQTPTSTQTRRKRVDRWQAMQGVFAVIDPSAIRGKHLVVIDDVVTTGATLVSLCETLNAHQPTSIQIIAMATGK